jgi:CRP-like cAMP-binding protein
MTITTDLRVHLRQIPLFSNLDENALQLLVDRCQRRRVAGKTVLFHEGDPGLTLYVIISGIVNIERATATGETVHIAKRGPGDHFGEFSLVDEKPRSATAVTDSSCEILVLHRQEFIRCIETEPSLALNIIKSLVMRLREAADRTVSYRTLDVMGRLASFLLEAASAGKAAEGGGTEIVRITEQEIADRIGATRESVNRKLAYLKNAGIIKRDGRRLVVMQPESLRTFCAT